MLALLDVKAVDPAAVSYVGVFLDEESRRELLERVWPVHPVMHADHVTIAFKPDEHVLSHWRPMIGQRARLEVVRHHVDDRGQAVVVSGVRADGLALHITISCAHGVAAAYSNDLLKQQSVDLARSSESFILFGVIDTFPRTKKEEEDDCERL